MISKVKEGNIQSVCCTLASEMSPPRVSQPRDFYYTRVNSRRVGKVLAYQVLRRNLDLLDLTASARSLP